MNSDFKIENESFWFDPLDEFQLFDEIVVVNISEEDLLSNNTSGLYELACVEFGDWDALEKILGKKETDLHKLDFDNGDTSWIVFLYTNSKYVTCISG